MPGWRESACPDFWDDAFFSHDGTKHMAPQSINAPWRWPVHSARWWYVYASRRRRLHTAGRRPFQPARGWLVNPPGWRPFEPFWWRHVIAAWVRSIFSPWRRSFQSPRWWLVVSAGWWALRRLRPEPLSFQPAPDDTFHPVPSLARDARYRRPACPSASSGHLSNRAEIVSTKRQGWLIVC